MSTINYLWWKTKYLSDSLLNQIIWAIVWALPKRVIYVAGIRMIAHATTGQYAQTDTGDIRAMTCLRRWSVK